MFGLLLSPEENAQPPICEYRVAYEAQELLKSVVGLYNNARPHSYKKLAISKH